MQTLLQGTVERWAFDYVSSADLSFKLAPPTPPDVWQDDAELLLLESPGRDGSWKTTRRSPRTPGAAALARPQRRAELLHTFLHHELQAAELMCRSILAYPSTERAFRRGLLQICLDEIRHMAMYEEHLQRLGHRPGDFPVNDWFWSRVPTAADELQFVALMGLGFEGGNLDHTRRFAALFRAAGDEAAAELQERVGEEEIPHVAFAAHWFERWTGGLEFERWCAELPRPLTPLLMRGPTLNLRDRQRAGYTPAFLRELEAWQPEPRGS